MGRERREQNCVYLIIIVDRAGGVPNGEWSNPVSHLVKGFKIIALNAGTSIKMEMKWGRLEQLVTPGF